MKKFLLKIMLCATMMLALGGVTTPLIVSADEGVETPEISVEITDTDIVSSEEETAENDTEIVEKTETSKWFDETIKPLALEFFAVAVGFSAVTAISWKKLKKTMAALAEAVAALAQSIAENKALRKEMRKGMNAVADALKDIREGLETKVIDVDEIVHKLLDVEKLAYGNNAHLVSNGTAKRIAEVIGNGKKEEIENKN